MTKKEYLQKVQELATKCKLFAEKTCSEWREETSMEASNGHDLSEMREVYFSLQALRHASEKLLERAKLVS